MPLVYSSMPVNLSTWVAEIMSKLGGSGVRTSTVRVAMVPCTVDVASR